MSSIRSAVSRRLRDVQVALLMALAVAALAPRNASADAAAGALSEADQQCLGCHGEKGLAKTLDKGASVPLHVAGTAFAKSVHAQVGCAGCHGDVDSAKHPAESKSFADERALSVAMGQACRNCHEESFKAHAASVHGRSQAKDGVPTPLCVTCHGTHDIQRASVGSALRDACLGCHADAPAAHDKWLPNTKLHLTVVSCSACHAPGVAKRVELRFYDLAGGNELVSDGKGLPAANGKEKLDAGRLRELVQAVDRSSNATDVVLAGRIEPASAAEGHAILAKSQAVRECATCHRKGAAPFQNVSLSLVGPDGQRVAYEAHKDVLHAPTSVESVRGFYALGGTRIEILDIVLALALAGGISAPLGHMIVRRLLRRKGERHE